MIGVLMGSVSTHLGWASPPVWTQDSRASWLWCTAALEILGIEAD
jgi:hypothetical protein